MMRAFLLLNLFPIFLSAQSVSKKARAFFIGNSYTHVNTLPVLIAAIAAAQGDTLVHDNYTPGGYTMNNHFNDANCRAKIALGNWQYVVLQAQSQEPSFSPLQVNAQTLPYVLKLDSLIKKFNTCATTVLYETWGRKNGDQSNCGFYPPVCTYTGMQNRLRDSYKLFADSVKGIISSVGEAFRSSISATPTLDLYQADESHPSLAGSYLAAAVFYETLFQKSVLSNSYNPGLNTNERNMLLQTAHAIVHDSLSTWNLGKNHPWAAFAPLQNNLNIQCHSASPTLTNTWYFGDGSSSSVSNPAHLYSNAGTYTVSHVVTQGCKKDSAVKVVSVSAAVGVNERGVDGSPRISPNPATDRLVLSGGSYSSPFARVVICDQLGKQVYDEAFTSFIDISELPEGIYYLSYKNEQHSSHFRFIKMAN